MGHHWVYFMGEAMLATWFQLPLWLYASLTCGNSVSGLFAAKLPSSLSLCSCWWKHTLFLVVFSQMIFPKNSTCILFNSQVLALFLMEMWCGEDGLLINRKKAPLHFSFRVWRCCMQKVCLSSNRCLNKLNKWMCFPLDFVILKFMKKGEA